MTAKLERAVILDRADPPDIVALIDELVLHRLIGSPEIMHDQLTHVADLAQRPYVCIQVVPTAVGATAGLSGAVNLASGDGSPDVLHTDAIPEGHTTESRSLVRNAAVAFERIRGYTIGTGRPRATARLARRALRLGEPLVQPGSQVGVPACDLVQILTAVQAAAKLPVVDLPPGLLLQDYQIRPDDLHHHPRSGPGMPVRDRYGRLTGEQRHLDAGLISPGELDVSLGGDALQLRVARLETVGDLFQPGPGRWAERTVPLFQDPLLVGIQ